MHQILLSKASKQMHEPHVPMLFPLLGAHVCGSEFQYTDLRWKKLCGPMANLVAESGGNKGQTVTTRRGHLSRLPPARRGGAEETGRMAAQVNAIFEWPGAP